MWVVVVVVWGGGCREGVQTIDGIGLLELPGRCDAPSLESRCCYAHTAATAGLLLQEMQQELELQAPRIDELGQRAAVAHDQLGDLSREARRV